jgi:MurNAc alpha-1-phosphate uridylyltransferase
MSDQKLPVMIFGAGFGTRMRELTKSTPKPLIPVASKPLIDHALDLADARSCVVNTHYLADQMQSHLQGRKNTVISHETPDILETGGGLKAALHLLGAAPVLTLNSDAIWSGPNPLDLLENAWQPDHMDALLLLIPLGRTIGFTRPGDFAISPSGQLSRHPEGMVYSGAQILKTDGLRTIPDLSFSLNVLWTKIQNQGRLFGLEYPGHWADVGTPEGIPLAEKLVKGPPCV